MATHPVDRLVTVLIRSNTSISGTTYRLTSSPIRASVLSYYFKYFESVLWRSNNVEHMISASPQQWSTFRLILSWMLQCQQYGTTVRFPTKRWTNSYPSLALLHQSAQILKTRGLQDRLRARLEIADIEDWQIHELLAKVDVNDVAVQLVLEDLARKYARAAAQSDQPSLRQISRLVRRQNNSAFEQAFAQEVDRYRQGHDYALPLSTLVPPLANLPFLDSPLSVVESRGRLGLPSPHQCAHLESEEIGVRKVYDRFGDARLEWVRPSKRRPRSESSSYDVM